MSNCVVVGIKEMNKKQSRGIIPPRKRDNNGSCHARRECQCEGVIARDGRDRRMSASAKRII